MRPAITSRDPERRQVRKAAAVFVGLDWSSPGFRQLDPQLFPVLLWYFTISRYAFSSINMNTLVKYIENL